MFTVNTKTYCSGLISEVFSVMKPGNFEGQNLKGPVALGRVFPVIISSCHYHNKSTKKPPKTSNQKHLEIFLEVPSSSIGGVCASCLEAVSSLQWTAIRVRPVDPCCVSSALFPHSPVLILTKK